MRWRTSKPAPAAIAFQRIGGIGDQLQFSQNKLRDSQSAVDESGLRNIGDSAVDNHTGIQDVKFRLVTGFTAVTGSEAAPLLQENPRVPPSVRPR